VQPAGEAREAEVLPVIRAGDRLIVEEHTARVDVVLEARALNPAAAGSAFDVRLAIGGNRVRAIALGPGRAALQTITGERP
jgi:flagella basal body P-ring formation protein FlgA